MDPLTLLAQVAQVIEPVQEPDLGAAELLTVAGASAAAITIAMFARAAGNLTTRTTRLVALFVGLVVVVVVTVTTSRPADVLTILLSIVVGAQAGLAASETITISRNGFSAESVRVPDKSIGHDPGI